MRNQFMSQTNYPDVIAPATNCDGQSRYEEPILATQDIQGNILGGFNKDHQMLIFLKITQVAAAKQWLRTIEPYIATAAEVIKFNQLFKSTRDRRYGQEGTVRATFINLAFTYEGLKKLTPEAEQFTDAAFKDGLHNRSASLGDPTDPNAPGHPSQWLIGGAHNVPDLVVIIGSDDQPRLNETVEWLEASLCMGLEVMFKQRGKTLPGALTGHEHFGFKDGISQPGIRGRLPEAPHAFLTPREAKDETTGKIDPDKGKPGQDVLHAGEFVFGYPTQISEPDPDKEGLNITPGPIATAGPTWATNGSYLVFRRLRQDVKGFQSFIKATATTLSTTNPAFAGITLEKLGAKFVGRWASGAPITNAPDRDNPALAEDLDFEFEAKNAQGVAKDPIGLRCPFAGHIRKAYPRDTERDSGINESNTQTHRLLRRGIPFGKPYAGGCPVHPDRLLDTVTTWWENLVNNQPTDRGLLFLAYQTSIERQFEFVTNAWVNNPNFPDPESGHDPILGQSQDPSTRDRTVVLQTAKTANNATIKLPTDWVIPTGGGYFFSPSINGIKYLAE
jgi:Dyp-type peroxidase family